LRTENSDSRESLPFKVSHQVVSAGYDGVVHQPQPVRSSAAGQRRGARRDVSTAGSRAIPPRSAMPRDHVVLTSQHVVHCSRQAGLGLAQLNFLDAHQLMTGSQILWTISPKHLVRGLPFRVPFLDAGPFLRRVAIIKARNVALAKAVKNFECLRDISTRRAFAEIGLSAEHR
jgi:hypothetical protein